MAHIHVICMDDQTMRAQFDVEDVTVTGLDDCFPVSDVVFSEGLNSGFYLIFFNF